MMVFPVLKDFYDDNSCPGSKQIAKHKADSFVYFFPQFCDTLFFFNEVLSHTTQHFLK